MKKPIHELVVPQVLRLQSYVPGKPIEEVERELGIHAIKMASNENPLGPSPKAVEAIIRFLPQANRYPDGSGYYLREKLATRLGISMDEIILGAGSTELIELVARTFATPADEVVSSEGSFVMYSVAAQEVGAKLLLAPLRSHTYDLDAVAERLSERTRVVYLANPNNPTGTMFPADAFDRFLRRVPDDVLVVLDEAYYEYVESPNYSRSLDYVRERRHLLVLRTFSKVYGLAGLRIGYGIGHPELIACLNRVRSPFNTTAVSQVAALAALDDAEHVAKSLANNRAGLRALSEGLMTLGATFLSSVANFLLVFTEESAEEEYEALLRQGVIVRPLRKFGYPRAFRVAVGKPEENEKFLEALKTVRQARSSRVGRVRAT